MNDKPDAVNSPDHYTQGGIEAIFAIRAALGEEGFTHYCVGNALKYLWRYRHKGGMVDLLKADKYVRWAISSLEESES